MTELWQALVQIGEGLWQLLAALVQLTLSWSLLIAWFGWWLLGVNWKHAWPVLAQGGWVVVVLMTVASALAWSQLEPADCHCLQFVTLPNFWWQLGGVSLLVSLTLFCGWLQGVIGWTPTEVPLAEPEAPGEGHGEHHH